ncbi:MAG: CapA family protein [Anaerolineales bacterium]|nr:CapA family protein [Anaerolineales bacterium]
MVWIDPVFPTNLKEMIHIPQGFSETDRPEEASIKIFIGDQDVVGYWTYVLVSPFPSLHEGIKPTRLKLFWEGISKGLYANQPLLMSDETRHMLSSRLGPPDVDSISIVPENEILDTLWPDPESWAVIPFSELEPKWKILSVSGQKAIHEDFTPSTDLLSIPISVSGYPDHRESFLSKNTNLTNRNPEEMTTLILTGVTALVRDTARLMEEKGITYPAENIGAFLQSADFTHINNEVPFVSNCPPATIDSSSQRFCSDDRYLELLNFIGADIIELSGDHLGDYGPEAMFHTLDLYQELDLDVYGGGKNLQAGLKPLTFSHHGNKFAFFGCNAKSSKRYATASAYSPGAARCDFPWMRQEIQKLKGEGYLPIVTMQHEEVYGNQSRINRGDFQSLAYSGAVIVSGSQAHQPQPIEFYADSLIHYGLGNLFFDQYDISQRLPFYQYTDKAFLDLHVFYQNRHLNTELITIQFVDDAKTRFMTEKERKDLLSYVFNLSNW